MTSPPNRHVPVLNAALDTVERELGKTVTLRVRRLNEIGAHAFLYAWVLEASDRFIDYTGTPFDEAARNGGMSNSFAALLTRRGDDWCVLEHVIGPTDVGWGDWGDAHGVPAAIFDIPTD